MREILFRGKRVDNGEWVYGLVWRKKYNDGNRIFISCFPDKDDNEEVRVVCHETVSQFTGLCDKNGKRIFEGDIVARYDDCEDDIMTEEYACVKYGVHNCGCCHSVYGFAPCSNIGAPKGLFSLSGSYNDDEKCEELVVVGNIHDNPELMKG